MHGYCLCRFFVCPFLVLDFAAQPKPKPKIALPSCKCLDLNLEQRDPLKVYGFNIQYQFILIHMNTGDVRREIP